jgi:hypothetical protein
MYFVADLPGQGDQDMIFINYFVRYQGQGTKTYLFLIELRCTFRSHDAISLLKPILLKLGCFFLLQLGMTGA